MNAGESVRVDRASLLVDVPSSATMAELSGVLSPLGLTVGVDAAAWEAVAELAVGEWLAQGAPGARDPWLDPADHLLAGFEAELPNGRTLVVRPTPRRATGPDLVALLVGARGRFLTLRRAWLRVHDASAGARVPRTAPFKADRDPPVSPDEEALLAAIGRELAGG